MSVPASAYSQAYHLPHPEEVAAGVEETAAGVVLAHLPHPEEEEVLTAHGIETVSTLVSTLVFTLVIVVGTTEVSTLVTVV